MNIRVNDEIMVRVGYANPVYRIGVVTKIDREEGADVIDYRDDHGNKFWCYPRQVVSHARPNV